MRVLGLFSFVHISHPFFFSLFQPFVMRIVLEKCLSIQASKTKVNNELTSVEVCKFLRKSSCDFW